jgi:hypothetical protein
MMTTISESDRVGAHPDLVEVLLSSEARWHRRLACARTEQARRLFHLFRRDFIAAMMNPP